MGVGNGGKPCTAIRPIKTTPLLFLFLLVPFLLQESSLRHDNFLLSLRMFCSILPWGPSLLLPLSRVKIHLFLPPLPSPPPPPPPPPPSSQSRVKKKRTESVISFFLRMSEFDFYVRTNRVLKQKNRGSIIRLLTQFSLYLVCTSRVQLQKLGKPKVFIFYYGVTTTQFFFLLLSFQVCPTRYTAPFTSPVNIWPVSNITTCLTLL